MNGIPLSPSPGQWVGIVILLAMFALCLYAAFEWKGAMWVDSDENPIPPFDPNHTPIADEALRAIRDSADAMLRGDR